MEEAECDTLVRIAIDKMVEGEPSYTMVRVELELSLGTAFLLVSPLAGSARGGVKWSRHHLFSLNEYYIL